MSSDFELDARLCEVPLPDGLLDRLRAVAVTSEASVDRDLCDVPVPRGLTDRINAAVEQEALAEMLASVPVPTTLMARLRVVPQVRERSTLGQLALAASLMLVVGSGLLAVLGGLLEGIRPHQVASPFVLPLESSPAVKSGVIQKPVRLSQLELKKQRPLMLEAPPVEVAIDVPRLSGAPKPKPGPRPVSGLLRELESGLPISSDFVEIAYAGSTFTHKTEDEPQDLESTPDLLTGNMGLPLFRGIDSRMFYNKGVFPPFPLAADPSLQHSKPPLSTRTESVERLRRSLDDGRLPERVDIRVEDFLAAIDYGFAAVPPGELDIRRAAGPSVFRDPGTGAGLVQIGVKAGPTSLAERPGVHLVVAIDVSASMSGWLPACREGLRRALGDLGPQDRLSLVAFNQGLVASAENVSMQQQSLAEQVYDLLDALKTRGGTNLTLGLNEAMSFAMADGERPARIVLVTDGPGEVPADIHRMLESARPRDLQLSVIELGDGLRTDDRLGELAKAGGGLLYQGDSSQHVRWTLVEALSGRSSVAAVDARLEVEFFPEAVESYRLLGHERTTLADFVPVTVSAELHSGEEASVLYEIWLKPNAVDDVARARVLWRDPTSDRERRSPWRRVSRLQFGLSFEQSAVSLQAAAIAAEAAEVLRESPFARSRSRSLQHVLAQVGQVDSKLAEGPVFQSFVDLLRKTEGVRRRGGL